MLVIAVSYTFFSKSQTWALSPTLWEGCMAGIYEVIFGLELAEEVTC